MQEGFAIESFDLLEFQKRARDICDPKKLFELWEDICARYERHEIGTYEVDEMKEVIWPSLQALASLRRSVNETPPAQTEQIRRRA